jgi:peptide subunit release factor 1 (eRF1)
MLSSVAAMAGTLQKIRQHKSIEGNGLMLFCGTTVNKLINRKVSFFSFKNPAK